MSDHAFLAPSSAHRWVICPASAALEALYPEAEEQPEAAAGTAAHWVFEQTLRGHPPAVGAPTPNGLTVSEEMIEAADEVYDDARVVLFPFYGERWREALSIEQRVRIPRVHPTQCWGTPDIRAWSRRADGRLVLHLWDFKFGHGVVEAFENWQLLAYMAGVFDEASIDGMADQQTVVDLRVIQPRAPHRDGPVRSWQAMGSDLRGYVNRLHMAAEEATSGHAKARPHPEACRNCRARLHCDALRRQGFSDADTAYAATTHDLTPEQVGIELRFLTAALGRMEARVSGLREQAAAFIKRGEPVPWWALESSAGRLSWNIPVGQVVAIGQIFGQDLSKPDVVTPTQAIKKIPQLETAIRTQYASRPVGSTKLVPDDGTKARRIFSAKP